MKKAIFLVLFVIFAVAAPSCVGEKPAGPVETVQPAPVETTGKPPKETAPENPAEPDAIAKLKAGEITVDESVRRIIALDAKARKHCIAFLKDGDEKVRLAAASALVAIEEGRDAVRTLTRLLRASSDRGIRMQAAGALEQLAARYDAGVLENNILAIAPLRRNDKKLQYAAIGLITALDVEKDTEVKIAVARALLMLADDRGAQQYLAEQVRGTFRPAAVLALAETGNGGALLGELRKLAREPGDYGRRARSALALAALRETFLDKESVASVRKADVLNEILRFADQVYVDKGFDRKKLLEAAAKSMVRTLDPFSAYYDRSDLKAFTDQMTQKYGGIGAWVGLRDDRFRIIAPMPGGPAAKAGLKSMDVILEIDGTKVSSFPQTKLLREAVKRLKGRPDTVVGVKVYRHGWLQAQSFKITRKLISVKSVRSTMLPGSIGFAVVSRFTEKTSDELVAALDDLEKKGMQALVLDLRNNPGGFLKQAINVSDLFLPKGRMIVSSKGRKKRESFLSTDGTTRKRYPVVVLINAGSASASEIVAGALKDNKRAKLIGEKTFGKGSVQRLFSLSSTNAETRVKLTIAKYYLPSGRCIHEVGVEPTVAVAEPTASVESALAIAELRKEGVFADYLNKHYDANKELFARLAERDDRDASKYPGFDALYASLAKKVPKDMVRRQLRALLRGRVADERGKLFIADAEEDVVLQRGIIELFKELKKDITAVAAYKAFLTEVPVHGKDDKAR